MHEIRFTIVRAHELERFLDKQDRMACRRAYGVGGDERRAQVRVDVGVAVTVGVRLAEAVPVAVGVAVSAGRVVAVGVGLGPTGPSSTLAHHVPQRSSSIVGPTLAAAYS